MDGRRSAVVVGGGVVGLSSALCCQAKGFNVTIFADRFLQETTSHVAGGIFLPYNRAVLGMDRKDEAKKVVRLSWHHYNNLHEHSAKHTGIMRSFGYQCYFTENYGDNLPDEPLVWDVADKLRELSNEELMRLSPENPCSGWIIQTYIIQGKYYLPYLQHKFLEQGGRVFQKTIKSLSELSGYDVIINCTGLGAKELAGDPKVHPALGQVAHLRAPYLKNFFHCEEVFDMPPDKRKLLYILPQSEHVVIGGTYVENSTETQPKADVRNSFIKQLCYVEPTLQNCEIMFEVCGLRPARSPVRLEAETIVTESGLKLKVVHNYGHGGNGIALSWGTAELAADMADAITQKSRI